MLKQRKSIVGLDIGSSSIKAVELTRDKYDFVITGYSQIEVHNEAARQEAIAELLRAARFRSKRVATAVSGKNVVFRYISMPEMPEDKLVQAVRLDADKYIPFAVEDVEIDAQKLALVQDGNNKNEMKVLLVAAKKSVVADHSRMLVELGLQPVAVGVDGFALGNAWELGDMVNPGIQDPGRTVALVDIGATKASINILRDNVSYFAREVPMGGQDLTNAIARRLGIEPAQAETMKRDPGAEVAVVQEAVAQVLEDLGNEINLSFDFFENQFDGEVQEVFLTGGTALLPFLEESFERIFEKRTKTWNPIEGLKVKADNVDVEALNQLAPQLAVAIGLAAAS
ncbi:MAG: type IV pilus assembly protein PilM [Planctomycetes bacterium]|nr:type IV pilus assembly protein PilM [Planctomycetota bacterium]MBZ0153974.1 pilus assembly protein PilM [Planctomycetota bacterium]MCC7399196.1 type IV pilus assembly protein PilM [Planctomycetota bacterium]